MAAFVQLKNEWLNLDRVDVVCLNPDTGNVTVVWADQTRSTYHDEDARKLLEAMKPLNTGKMHEPQEAMGKPVPGSFGAEMVEAGVDPNHQTEQCDHCKKPLTQDDEIIPTCDQYRYLTLCRGCHDKAGNRVR